jgi:membrane protein DedA with SNARE-associated domain
MLILFIVVIALMIGMIIGYAITIMHLLDRVELKARRKLSRADFGKLQTLLKKLQ